MMRTTCIAAALVLLATTTQAQSIGKEKRSIFKSIGCSHLANSSTIFRISEVSTVAAHGADLASTEHCLGAGRCHELNGWLARYDNPAAFGAAKMGVAAIGIWLTAKLRESLPDNRQWIATAVNFGITGAYAGIAAHNAKVAGQ